MRVLASGWQPGSRPRIYRDLVAGRSNFVDKPCGPGGGHYMVESASSVIEETQAPTLASNDRSIDLVHLARMTLGDRGLEREVLALFDRQAAMLVARMQVAEPRAIAAVAHTIKGSARGVGAWRVAGAAEAVERAASGGPAELGAAIGRLDAAAQEARAMIAELLRAH